MPHLQKFQKLTCVVGMQYGSEGKGAVTSYLAPLVTMGVRTGAANAGHTIYYNGQKVVMRQLPSVWTNPHARLVVGIGSVISLDVLLHEIQLVERLIGVGGRLYIDSKAHVITAAQILDEKTSNLAVRIGSTSAIGGEGIGVATADKVLRKTTCVQAHAVPELGPYLADTVDLINTHLECEGWVLLEGTQGLGLSLEHGSFPYVTSRDTSVSALAASAGIATHQFQVEVIGVTRTYPIRVAGNSGPFGADSQEISWDDITKLSGSLIAISETTSVTRTIRRVATFSWSDFLKSCQVNQPTEIALTFADYLDYSIHEQSQLTKPIETFIAKLEEVSGVDVRLVKTGPQTVIDRDSYRAKIMRQIA